MIEVPHVRQIPGEPRRRWFSSEQFDLIVRFDPDGSIIGFELCYDKPHKEHALVFGVADGYRHMVVDDGEQRPGRYKASPVLLADGVFDSGRVLAEFSAACDGLPVEIADFVRAALARHPEVDAD